MDIQKTGIIASHKPSHGQSTADGASAESKDSKQLEASVNVTDGLSPSASSVDLPAYYDLDKKYKASTVEIWSYYLYLVANSGATLSNFAPTAFQNLLSQAAGDVGVLPFAGK